MSASTSRRRVTYAQLEALWEILNAHRDLALGYNKSVQAREHSRRMWVLVADTLNSLGEGAYKDYKGWSSYWVDFKGKLKRRYATIRASRSRTGGGPSDVPELTDIEKKYLIIFGEDYGTGLPGIQVDPFPDSDTTNAPSKNSPTILVAPQPSTSSEDLFILENIQAEEINQQNESAGDDSISHISCELPVASTIILEPTDVRPAHIEQPQNRRQRRRPQLTRDATRRALLSATQQRAAAATQSSKILAESLRVLTRIAEVLECIEGRLSSVSTTAEQ